MRNLQYIKTLRTPYTLYGNIHHIWQVLELVSRLTYTCQHTLKGVMLFEYVCENKLSWEFFCHFIIFTLEKKKKTEQQF